MTENVRKFEKALRESEELQRRLTKELKKIAEERSASNRQPGAGASQITTATPPGTTILLISRVPPASAIMTVSPCSMIPRWMSSSKKRKSLSIVKT